MEECEGGSRCDQGGEHATMYFTIYCIETSNNYTILHKTLSVLQKFSGSLEAMIRLANGDAWSLVEVVASSFASYRDITSYNRQSVSFLKRAQLFASDLCHVLGGRSFSALEGIDKLTMFADYRVPQVSTKHPSWLVFVGMFEICFP